MHERGTVGLCLPQKAGNEGHCEMGLRRLLAALEKLALPRTLCVREPPDVCALGGGGSRRLGYVGGQHLKEFTVHQIEQTLVITNNQRQCFMMYCSTEPGANRGIEILGREGPEVKHL
jgi:hypothetical protein